MNIRLRHLFSVAAVIGLGFGSASEPSHAATVPNQAARIAAFSKLPYWPGLWLQISTGPSGYPVGPSGHEEIVGVGNTQIAGLHPPFTKAWLQEMKSEPQMHPETDSDSICSFAFPWLMESTSLTFTFVISPEKTAIIFNDGEVRQIYTDGKGHTPEDERVQTPWGDSAGHWEGDTLVVDTVSTGGRLLFDNNGKPGMTVLSDQSVYHERIRMIDPNTLEDRITIEDPVALKAPWGFVRKYHRVQGMDRMVLELDCGPGATNNRNPIVNGKGQFIGPKD